MAEEDRVVVPSEKNHGQCCNLRAEDSSYNEIYENNDEDVDEWRKPSRLSDSTDVADCASEPRNRIQSYKVQGDRLGAPEINESLRGKQRFGFDYVNVNVPKTDRTPGANGIDAIYHKKWYDYRN